MYDPTTNDHFSVEKSDTIWWNQSEPIWITARRQGIPTSISFWPGSSVIWPGNITADYYRPKYDPDIPFETRIDEVVDGFTNKNVRLGMLYYNHPDVEGHYNGVNSPQVDTSLQQVDWYLSYILETVREKGLHDLNIIVCADHGMANITNQMYLEDYVDMSQVEQVPSYGAVTHVQPKEGQMWSVLNALIQGARVTKKYRVFRKSELPEEFHYVNNVRIMDIIVVGELGTYMSPNKASKYRKTASHGYDPKYLEMRPIFMALGPVFKKGGYQVKKTFRTKDIYGIMTYVTGIEPFPNNSTFSDFEELFDETSSGGGRIVHSHITLIVVLLFNLVIFK